MKRAISSLFLVILFFLPSLACGSFTTNSVRGSGDVITQTIDVSGFDRVALEGFGSVFVEQGDTESLTVRTDDNIIPLLDIQVRGNELQLGIKQGYDVIPSQSITFHVTLKNLSAVVLNGSGSFYVEPISAQDLRAVIRGSGDIDIQGLIADDLSIELDGSGNIAIQNIEGKGITTSLQGSGDINLEGQANTQKVNVQGSGNYLAEDLETSSADVSIPGSGNITVWTHDDLKVRVNGSGDIQYYGQPTIDQSIFGSGNITSLGEK